MTSELRKNSISNPILVLKEWIGEARKSEIQPNPNTMSISTVDSMGCPNSRMVLCKEINEDLGYLIFYTNYNSKKSKEIESHNNCSALFHWDPLGYQVRIRGKLIKSPNHESDNYFSTRKVGSQLSAWASNQSDHIENRESLDNQFQEIMKRFDILDSDLDSTEIKIPRPDFWGGYRIWVKEIELWLNQNDRFHDRLSFKRDLIKTSSGFDSKNDWVVKRLQP